MQHMETVVACQPRRIFANAHAYHVNSISVNSDGETFLTLYRVSGDNIDKIKDYGVSRRYEALQQDYARHLEMWTYFTRLIPVDQRLNITEFLIFEGGGDLAGFVEPLQDDLREWRMALAIDVAGNLEEIDLQEEFAAVAIHEYGIRSYFAELLPLR